MMCIFMSVLFIIIVLSSTLYGYSPRQPKPLKDAQGNKIAGSISEKIFVEINQWKQGMFISGIDSTKPVLLFLHGGPGMPEYAISRKYPMILEKHFTVCWWEQRGAGMSYKSKMKKEDLTFEMLIDDIIEVSKYLKSRFKKDKIYLMAHSGGTFIGIQAVAKAPELFKAYLTVAQITHQLESEQAAYRYMLEEYQRRNDKKMLGKFAKYTIDDINTPSYKVFRDKPMHQLGIGTTREMKSVVKGIFIPVMTNSDYTFKEKMNVWRGKHFTSKKAGLWNELVYINLIEKIKHIKIPIYFFHGVFDLTVSYPLAYQFFESIDSPHKVFYTFEQSAHSPFLEEPEKFEKIIINDIIQNK